MRATTVLLAAAVAAGLAAATPAMAQPRTLTPPPPMPTQAFLQAAAGSDQFEISEAQTALGQSRNPQVRAFAQTMIRDHAQDAQGLRQAATSGALQPPKMAMSGDQARMLGAIQSLRGQAFDKAYARQQVLAHVEALAVTRGYATGGADQGVRQAAQSAVPMIQRHLEMAQQLEAATGGA